MGYTLPMKFLLLLGALLLPFTASAGTGFVKLPDGHFVYADHSPARPGQPTVVLVNGLVYDLGRWKEFARPLAESGYGILRYYFRGQSKTLRKELEGGQPDFFRSGLDRRGFALELAQLMDALEINKGIIVGLSYGAGIAAEFGSLYPERVEKLVFMAPLVVPLDRYDASGAWIHQNLEALRFWWGPLWGAYVYDYYYNLIFRAYLNQRLVPERIPEEMSDIADAYKESTFHLVRAMRDLDLRTYDFPKLKGRVHLMLASDEDAPALKDQFAAWRGFKASQGSLVYLQPAWHAIPDSSGEFAAGLLRLIQEKGLSGVFYAPVEKGELVPVASSEELERAVFEGKKD